MTVTVTEQWKSRKRSISADSAEVSLIYLVEGTDNDVTAYDAAVTALASTYTFDGSGNSLYLSAVDLSRIGENEWTLNAKYTNRKGQAPPDSTYDFDTGGGTTHITNSIATVKSYAASGTAPDFGKLIGVTKDSVAGVDVTIPNYRFTESHQFDTSTITAAYKTTLFSLTGCVNNATFKGFDAGSVLFLGASGNQKGEEDWQITYQFACSPNATGLSVGSITGIAKRGWDYLWVMYDDAEDTTAKRIVKSPVAAYVEQVYTYADFSGLGI